MRTSVELKVARAGYQDAAEMMYSAQSRIRDLEKLLYEERERVGKLEETLAEKNEKSQLEMEKALEEMKDRLSSLSQATGTMNQVLGDMGRVTTCLLYTSLTMMTDLYQLTMMHGHFMRHAEEEAVFDLFFRNLRETAAMQL